MINECYRKDLEQSRFDKSMLEKENQELKKQQKEFIKYLKEPIRIITERNPINLSEYTSAKLDTLEEVLSKYKEITGTDINAGSMGGKEC